MKIFRYIRRPLRSERGAALIEFAFVLPVMLLLFFGIVELSNFVYASQKTQSAAGNMSNIINLQNNICTPQLEAISRMLPEIVEPFPAQINDYRVIVTAMQRDLDIGFGYVRWQKTFGGISDGSAFRYLPSGSREANQVQPAELNGFVFAPGDQVIVVEVYFDYTPILFNLGNIIQYDLGLENARLYYQSPPTRPRVGSFQLDPDSPSCVA